MLELVGDVEEEGPTEVVVVVGVVGVVGGGVVGGVVGVWGVGVVEVVEVVGGRPLVELEVVVVVVVVAVVVVVVANVSRDPSLLSLLFGNPKKDWQSKKGNQVSKNRQVNRRGATNPELRKLKSSKN